MLCNTAKAVSFQLSYKYKYIYIYNNCFGINNSITMNSIDNIYIYIYTHPAKEIHNVGISEQLTPQAEVRCTETKVQTLTQMLNDLGGT